jgi:hypothetical protein
VRLNLHDPKTRQRVLIGAGGIAAVVAYLIVRHGAGAATTAPAASTVTDPTIDPATGLPYALEQGGLGSGDLSGGDGGSLGVTADTPDLADAAAAAAVPDLLPDVAAAPASGLIEGLPPRPVHKRTHDRTPHHATHPHGRRHPRGQHQHDGPHAQHKHRPDRAKTKPRVKPPDRAKPGVKVPPPPKAPAAVRGGDGAVRGHPAARKKRKH